MGNRSTLSLSMIVRNEESNIGKCLESVQKIADEIIVVDTGSQDKTIDTARKYGAKVFQLAWGGDFSEARNFALSKCETDFVLYLDADEELDDGSIEVIRSLLERNETTAYRCRIKSKTGSDGKITYGYYTRLFPNFVGASFAGKAHEQIEPSIVEHGIPIKDSKITIIHHGYDVDDDALREKAERNLPLLLDEFHNNPTSYYAYQLGQTFSILGQEEEAKVYFEYALNDSNLPDDYKFYALQYIANYHLKKRDLDAAESVIFQLLDAEPNQSSAYLLCSKIYAVSKNWDEALLFAFTAFEKCKRENTTGAGRLVGEECDIIQIITYGLQISVHSDSREYFNTFSKLLNDYFDFDLNIILQALVDNKPISGDQKKRLVANVPRTLKETITVLLKNYGEKNEAEEILDAYCASGEPSVDMILLKSDLLIGRGEVEAAQKLLEDSYKNFPVNPGPALYLLSIYLEMGNGRGIEAVLEFIESQFSESPEVLEGLNTLLKKVG